MQAHMAKIKSKNLGKTTQLRLTQEQYKALREGGFKTGRGGPQDTFARVLGQVRTTTGEPIAHATDRELNGLRTASNLPGSGGWQEWARDVLKQNGVA